MVILDIGNGDGNGWGYGCGDGGGDGWGTGKGYGSGLGDGCGFIHASHRYQHAGGRVARLAGVAGA